MFVVAAAALTTVSCSSDSEESVNNSVSGTMFVAENPGTTSTRTELNPNDEITPMWSGNELLSVVTSGNGGRIYRFNAAGSGRLTGFTAGESSTNQLTDEFRGGADHGYGIIGFDGAVTPGSSRADITIGDNIIGERLSTWAPASDVLVTKFDKESVTKFSSEGEPVKLRFKRLNSVLKLMMRAENTSDLHGFHVDEIQMRVMSDKVNFKGSIGYDFTTGKQSMSYDTDGYITMHHAEEDVNMFTFARTEEHTVYFSCLPMTLEPGMKVELLLKQNGLLFVRKILEIKEEIKLEPAYVNTFSVVVTHKDKIRL